jgi:uncharacterized hydrophobic protein (TIGR00271 family)
MMGFLRNFIADNQFKPENLPAFEDKLFFEGDKWRAKLEQYVVLLFLSAVISTYGVIGDSTAVVIGAMIIAPLMRPIMATTAGLVMGDMKRAGTSFAIVIASVAGVIGLSWFLAEISVAAVISFESNSQLIGRISPRLIDLYVALASGAAGAYALSRENVSDSLPGVAIAISLVPPLCVVGIGLAEGDWSAAGGAMLLFLTNFLSILLTGGGLLALLGLRVPTAKKQSPGARRKAFIFVAIGALLITIPLGVSTWQVFLQNQIRQETIQVSQAWMAGTDYELSQIQVSGNHIDLVIHGSGEHPTVSELGERLDAALDQQFDLSLIVIPSKHEDYVPLLEQEDGTH